MHSHSHQRSQRFIWAISLTGIIFLVELIGGWWTGSLALLSDSAHVFMDLFALTLSFLAVWVSARPANERHSFGFHRLQILAAFINGLSLFFIAFEILREAWKRIHAPSAIQAGPMLLIAIVGLGVNLLVMFVLHEHSQDDINTRSAFWHVLGDTLASVGVIAAGLLIWFTGWQWVDPVISVGIGLMVLGGAWRILRESVHILNEGVPPHISLSEVLDTMQSVKGVVRVHDLHIWMISPDYTALSAHVVTDENTIRQGDKILRELAAVLRNTFDIDHTALQLEYEPCENDDVLCSH